MPERSSIKKRDLIQVAARVASLATGWDDAAGLPSKHRKNAAVVALGRPGGLKGGKARAVALSAPERSEIAKKAAVARWSAKP